MARFRFLLTVIVWFGLAIGFLSLAALPGDDLTHAFCGPWGCLPPVQALAALHAFWALVLGTLVLLAFRYLAPGTVRWIGITLATCGAVGLIWILVREAPVWLTADNRRLFVKRVLFVLATMTDTPILEALIAGLLCWAGSRRRIKDASVQPTPMEPR